MASVSPVLARLVLRVVLPRVGRWKGLPPGGR